MRSWFRTALPPVAAIALVAGIYILLEVGALCWEWYAGVAFFSMREMRDLVGAWPRACGLMYGAYRVWAFHPALRPSYCAWLALTPWTNGKPLPLGPVHLVMQDVLLIWATVGLVWMRMGAGSLDVVQIFLLMYLACLGFTHAITGERWEFYLVASGLGFMVLAYTQLEYFAVAAALTYVIAILGTQSSLGRFPWPEFPGGKDWNTLKRSRALGWPFDQAGPPRKNPFEIGLMDRFLVGILAGWWIFVLSFHVPNTEAPLRFVPFYYILVPGLIGRLIVYCNGYAPPLNLLGRLAHGRPILWGYDQIFVSPLLAAAIGLLLPFVPGWTGVDVRLVVSIGMALTCWVLLILGPDLMTWRLTGNHRMTAAIVLRKSETRRQLGQAA